MQTAIAVILAAVGVWLFFLIFRAVRGMKERLAQMAADPAPRLSRSEPEEGVGADGLVYLFAQDFVKPAPRRPMGSIPRDRAYACQTEDELDPEDFARQLLYATFTELLNEGYLETRYIKRDPTFMPPHPHKQWELQFRARKPLPTFPLAESFGVGFELSRKNRLRGKKDQDELAPEEEYFSLDELLERALRAIRQEMTFWERGTCCSDLRAWVETALISQGYLLAPDKATWLDTVRKNRPQVHVVAVEPLQGEARGLGKRLEAFRQRFGSPTALQPEQDEKGQVVDIAPHLATHSGELDDMPLDDCLRLTIHEAIVAIKQLEPSGEAGI
jgi:hypothetical protein